MSCRAFSLSSLVPALVLISACGMGMQPADTLVVDDEDTEEVEEDEASDESSDDSSEDSDDWPFEDDDDDDTPADNQDDGGPDQDGQCDIEEFDALIHQAIQDNQNPEQPLFFYQARTSETAPFDELRIFSYQADPYTGPTGPGSYDLAGMNYADCSLCVLIIENCTDDYMCDKVYFSAAGTLDIDHMSTSGGPFVASLSNAVFEEVSIDADTFESWPVSGGDAWCVDSLDIELPIQVFE